MWQDFLTAIALVLVIEGIMPFISPRGYQNMMRIVQSLDEKSLRTTGFATMMVGVLLLLVVR